MKTMRIGLPAAVVALAACILTPVPGVSQQMRAAPGAIAGSVTGADGAPIGGVAVSLEPGGARTVGGADGSFRFGGLDAGPYTLTLTLGDRRATAAVAVDWGVEARADVEVDWQVAFGETITVVSASRRAERIVEAPAAVTLVTAAEIERQASHGQLPKLLEFTPGAEITASGLYDYNFNTRGFNSSLNRRVATLIDGRDPAVPFLGAQEWGAVSFPLDDLESAELVRGPSAALYGPNASSGVLNLVTKRPRDSQGGRIRLTAGELSTTNLDLRGAGELGEEWAFKVVGGLRSSGDFARSRNGRAEYSVPCGGAVRTDCLPQEAVALARQDDVGIVFAGLRFDRDLEAGLLTLEAGVASVEGPLFQTGIGRVQVLDSERPWARVNLARERWNVLATYTGRDAPRQLALSAGTNLALDSQNYGLEVQGNWGFADDRGRLVAGVSASEEEIDSFDPAVGGQTVIFAPIESDQQAVFGQLEYEVGDDVKIVLAARHDQSSLHDSQFSPKGAVVWSLAPRHTVRLTYNEAFQVPNYSEFFLQANALPPVNLQPFEGFCAPFGVSCGFAPGPTRIMALGNAALEVEEVETVELGYSGILGDKALLTIDLYTSENTNFITDLLPQLGTALGRINPAFGPYQPPSSLPPPLAAALLAALQGALGPNFFILSNNLDGTPILAAASYTNFGAVDTEGLDLGLSVDLGDGWSFNGSYSWFDFTVQDRLPGFDTLLLPNSPENKLSLGVGLVRDRWDANLGLRWVDDFRWGVGPFQGLVESYTVVDLTANRRLNDTWSVGLNIANLFDEEHWESFGGDLMGRRALGSVSFSW